MFSSIVTILHVLAALALIIVVLFQHGKGASMGASFGGSSQTLFGPRGAYTALAKVTTGAAVMFMLTSITLSIATDRVDGSSVMGQTGENIEVATELPESAPGEVEGGPTSGPMDTTAPVAPAEETTGGPVEEKDAGSQ